MPFIPRIEIPFSKTKLIFAFLGCLIFMAFGWLIIYLSGMPDVEAQPALIGTIVGWVFIGGFGLGLIANLKKLLHPRIGLIIDERGITDQTYAYSVGLIEWQDIEEIKVFKIRINLFPIKALLIKVKDPQKYIDRAEGSVTRRILQSNQLGYGTPISLTSAPLKCRFSQMESWIREALGKCKK